MIFSDDALFGFLYIEKIFQLPIQIKKTPHNLFAKAFKIFFALRVLLISASGEQNINLPKYLLTSYIKIYY